MRAVFGLVLIVGVALAGGAVMMAKNYIDAHQAALAAERAKGRQNIPTVDVYVATKQLSYGEKLTKENARLVAFPQSSTPQGVFTDTATLFPSDSPEFQRYVLRTIEPGEAILTSKVTQPGEEAGITSMLQPGMRAFTIRVDAVSGVSGFLRPGDHVDVYWTGVPPTATRQTKRNEVTRLIQPNMELIAVDQHVSSETMSDAAIARTVTVTGSPEQVAELTYAQSAGRLSLTLVGAEDDTIAAVMEVDQRSLFGLGAIEAPQAVEEEKVCTIRTRRGAEVVNIPIPCSD